MAASVRDGKREDLTDGTPFDLGASQAGSAKRRVPEILVGTFLVALFALAGAWFYADSTESTGYLALRRDVVRGQEISAEDLTVFQISTESEMQGIPVNGRNSVIGRVALVDMPVGSLVNQFQLADTTPIAPGEGIVGLALAPGEYPSRSMGPGDLVRVVLMPTAGLEPSAAEIEVIAERATVEEVAESGGGELFVSLSLSAEQADLTAAAAAQGRVRLIQVGG